MNLQRINDERLKNKNLKNIRFAYALQTLGIVAILAYNYVVKEVKNDPVWIVFLASTVILAFLSLKSDERLISKNLQKIRIAYVIQIIGIWCVLIYDFISGGIDKLSENPLWIVFIISTVVLTFLSMSTSVDYEDDRINAKKGLTISSIAVAIISIITGILISLNNDSTIYDGTLAGIVILICGLIPFIFLYGLRDIKNNDT